MPIYPFNIQAGTISLWQLFGLTGKLIPRHKLFNKLDGPEGKLAVASGKNTGAVYPPEGGKLK
jgi:hypothetical protein